MGTYLKKNFLICFFPLAPQAEQKEDDKHFADHLQIYNRIFTKAKKIRIMRRIPIELKIKFIQTENIFFLIHW